MKQVFTVSIDEEVAAKVRAKAKQKPFRNKSHLVELALEEFLEEEE